MMFKYLIIFLFLPNYLFAEYENYDKHRKYIKQYLAQSEALHNAEIDFPALGETYFPFKLYPSSPSQFYAMLYRTNFRERNNYNHFLSVFRIDGEDFYEEFKLNLGGRGTFHPYKLEVSNENKIIVSGNFHLNDPTCCPTFVGNIVVGKKGEYFQVLSQKTPETYKAPENTKKSLASELKAIGLNENNISHMILRGDEASELGDLTIKMPDTLKTIWGSIDSSRPYGVIYASGFRKLEIHYKKPEKKFITLYINISDATHIKGHTKRYRCLGLHAYLMKVRAYAKKNKQFPDGDDNGLYP